ncbi:MAG: hypothetical protein FWC91_12035 [Defluviitaleaceae bacterium]|nr:hypothetical protein [Defluviitaleaceae bacterium]
MFKKTFSLMFLLGLMLVMMITVMANDNYLEERTVLHFGSGSMDYMYRKVFE